MKFLALVLGLLSVPCIVKSKDALQRQKEEIKVPQKLLQETQGRTASVCAEIQPGTCKAIPGESEKMAHRAPNKVRKTMQAEYTASKKKETKTDTPRAAEAAQRMRPVQTAFYKEEPTCKGPLPQNGEKKSIAAQQLQRSNWAVVRYTGEMSTSCGVPKKVETFAYAIALTEGWGVYGSIPSRYRNPGDLKIMARGETYPGQVGVGKAQHVIFKNDAAGYAALYHQIDKMLNGESKFYTQEMTLQQVGKFYAQNSRRWASNMARYLGVPPSTTLEEYFELPPRVIIEPTGDTHGIVKILGIPQEAQGRR